MFHAGVQALEFGQGIERFVPEAGDLPFKRGRHGIDVDQVAVPIQRGALEADFNRVAVFMRLVFRAPIAADQVMPGGEFSPNGDRIPFLAVHFSSL